MSPFVKVKEPAWVSHDQLPKLPRRRLKAEHVDTFLDFLFSDIARKPEEVRLLEGAGVARYLRVLASEEEPGETRAVLEYLSNVTWATVLRDAPFKLGTKRATIAFLRRHSGTYLPEPAVEKALGVIREKDDPKGKAGRDDSPRLRSRSMSIEGERFAHLRDDLSERIYAAYWSLRLAKIHNARTRIAKVLKSTGIKYGGSKGAAETWDSDAVNDRVKQFEARSLGAARSLKKRRSKLRGTSAAKWLTLFYDRIENAEVYAQRALADTVQP